MICGWPTLPTFGALIAALTTGCAVPADRPAVAVPAIEHGRDARQADPCRLLTPTQLGELDLTAPGTRSRAPEGPRCEWRGPSGEVLGVSLYTDGAGLGALAAHSEPTTRRVRVAGFPALETFTGRGEFCQYDVGVADRQALLLTLEARTPDSCSTLQRIVPLVAGSLPPAGSS